MNHVAVALPLIIALVIMALAFDFINGLHDSANSIATVVSATTSLGIPAGSGTRDKLMSNLASCSQP